MDRNHIAYFVRVVERGSFTAAAAVLGVPKSTVSRAVAKLEDDLGVALLRRTTRAVTLTDAGHAYFERVKGAITMLDEAGTLARDAGGEAKGVVRLTAPVDAAALVLAPMLARFNRAHKGISVELLLTSRRVDLVQEGVDLALRAGRLLDSSLVARKFGTASAGLFASKAYLARRGAPKKVTDLAKHDCVAFRPQGDREWRLTGPRGEERVEVSCPLVADDLMFVRAAVVEGAGIGLVPSYLFSEDVRRGRVVRVLPAYSLREATLSIVYPASKYMPTRVALLRDFLVEELMRFSWDQARGEKVSV